MGDWLGDAGGSAKSVGEGAGDGVSSIAGDAGKVADLTAASAGADRAEMVFEAPSNLGGLDMPRTPGLGDRASMSELAQSGAVPGVRGVTLTDQVSDPAQLYGDMFELSQQNGIEYALTRETGELVLRSGAPNRVAVPLNAEPIAHTHPFDPETELPQTMPSRRDVNALNTLWRNSFNGPRPSSDVIWGSEPDQVTRYHATGMEEVPAPIKRGRTW